MYNPMQTQYNSLLQQEENLKRQRQLIEQQMQYQMPPININNVSSPMPQGNFDFNGKWVSDEQEARQTANNNLPLILFDKDNPIFYMKNIDGSFKKYQFTEIVEQSQENQLENKVNALEDKLNVILGAIQGQVTNNSKQEESSIKSKKGGK